ncbi:hypothetical protein XELAEV_18042891mg [Xenopus laevis]|uniref:Uncharacterized protein n=1 Tax=Xenopus laevis TaxID=8355 RepID=A0A974C4T4_XENLA|nr:hypothetical protein XELAEV_18042891mg [Xenopus laevis]
MAFIYCAAVTNANVWIMFMEMPRPSLCPFCAVTLPNKKFPYSTNRLKCLYWYITRQTAWSVTFHFIFY